ncbi:hypothetical protein BpHYR1_013272 [Brachionus plicatilis]|uniref:Uncharacterized protein n=1 Tax=Brachionus plicatilis TaxID=10195 RepID=A0A3M7SQP6_BRAPC|nr:hypothetical protein BpHYR1_013272 [Brachionus plicatilis]
MKDYIKLHQNLQSPVYQMILAINDKDLINFFRRFVNIETRFNKLNESIVSESKIQKEEHPFYGKKLKRMEGSKSFQTRRETKDTLSIRDLEKKYLNKHYLKQYNCLTKR